MTNIDAMISRTSVRTFSVKPIKQIQKDMINIILKDAELTTPMGTKVKFGFISLDEKNRSKSGEKIGTYGVVKNQQGYIYGICEHSTDGYLDFSYGLQNIIIELTKIGLGTVWLGGTFNKKGLFKTIKLKDNETIPAITAVGFKAGNIRLSEKIANKITGAKKRKTWDKIFFDNNFSKALNKDKLGDLKNAFEMVRISPSSMNLQNWKLLFINNDIHFYNIIKNRSSKSSRFYQALDIGIAMYQFEAAVKELDFKGDFIKSDPFIKTPSDFYTYYVTYRLKEV